MTLRRRIPAAAKPKPVQFSSPISPREQLYRDDHGHRFDTIAVVTFSILAFLTRFFRLSQPNSVVFDEFHFGHFLEKHLTNRFSFDIHPWLGKLTLAGFAWLTGFETTGFEYPLNTPYPNNSYYYARVAAALFGTACVPLMYLIARELHLSTTSSVVAAALPLLDMLLLIESRLILLDSQLVFYLELTLLCALRMWRLSESAYGSAKYYQALLGTSIAAAAALSIKWTTAVTPFLVAVVCAFGVIFIKRPTPLPDCILAAIIAIGVYTVPWYIHVKISTISTPQAMRMGDRFRQTLTGNSSFPYNPNHNVTFQESFYELHWRQFRANRKVKTRHLWESKWYEWPLNMRGIFYFIGPAPQTHDKVDRFRMIYLIQNPVGAIWVFAAVLAMFLLSLVVTRYRTIIPKKNRILPIVDRGIFLLAGYFLNLLPFMFVERCYFIYHYLPALTYGQLLTALLIDAMPKPLRLLFTALILTSVVAAFVFWAPWVYALPIKISGMTSRQWMPRWN